MNGSTGKQARADRRTGQIPYILGAAVLVQTADTTGIATALPELARSLNVDPATATLAMTSYLVAMALATPAGGWLADRFGGRAVLRWAIAIQTLAALACALSPNFTALVAARFAGGLAASVMLPVSRLTVIRSVPQDRMVSAVTTFATAGLVGPMLGPVLGGVMVQFLGWRAVFGVMVPLGVATFIAVGLLPAGRKEPDAGSLDTAGLAWSGGGLAVLVLAMELYGHGIAPATATGFALAGCVCFAALRLHTRRTPQPLVRFDLLKRRILRVSILADFAMRMLLIASPMLVSLLVQVGQDGSALATGLLLLAPTIGTFGMKPALSLGSRTWGIPRTMRLGGVIGAASFAAIALWPDAPLAALALLLGAHGMGRALLVNGGTVLNFTDARSHEMGAITGLVAIFQQIATVMGIGLAALLLRLFPANGLDLPAIQATMLAMSAIGFGGALILLAMPNRAGRLSPPA